MAKSKVGTPKKKRRRRDWAAEVGARAPSTRPGAAAMNQALRASAAASGPRRGFVSGKGLTEVGRNKMIAKGDLQRAREAAADDAHAAFLGRIERSHARYDRSGMSDDVTDSLLEQGSASLAHGVDQQAAFRAAMTMSATAADRVKPGLKAEGLSRNHVLADSSIESILHEAMAAYVPGNADHDRVLLDLFTALSGSPERGAAYLAAFQNAHALFLNPQAGNRGETALHDLIESVSVEPNNLVIADAARNTNQGARFDLPMGRPGRVNDAAANIYFAVSALGARRLISQRLQSSVQSLPMRTATGEYDSSSAARPLRQEDFLGSMQDHRAGRRQGDGAEAPPRSSSAPPITRKADGAPDGDVEMAEEDALDDEEMDDEELDDEELGDEDDEEDMDG